MTQIATLIFGVGILGLFWLDYDRKARTSIALWLPVIWVLISGSRMVSEWLGVAPLGDTPDRYLDGSPLDRNILMGLLATAVIVLINRGSRVGRVLRSN